MTGPQAESDKLFAAAEPWVILAASTLITACYRQNFSTIDLLRGPVRCAGQVQGKVAVIDVPTWFPAQEAVFELGDGALYAKLKDLPLPSRSQKVGEAVRWLLDLQSVAVPPQGQLPATVTLTYFPWFRFLAEPAGFDAMERAAEYVAACFEFMLRRAGVDATRSLEGEVWRIASDAGIRIDIHGLRSIQKLVVAKDDRQSTFDLKFRRIAIDRRMFPTACTAGDEMLKTADRPRHMTIEADATHLTLAAAKGA